MKKDSIPYEKHIFVCTNESGQCCGKDDQGQQVFRALREKAKEKGFHPRIRIAQAKCLGQCAKGVNIMSFPDNQWYFEVGLDDIDRLSAEFFM